jgi:hypothetical protein
MLAHDEDHGRAVCPLCLLFVGLILYPAMSLFINDFYAKTGAREDALSSCCFGPCLDHFPPISFYFG